MCQSPQNVRIICKWCHCPPDGQKLNVNYSTTLEKIVTSDKTWCSGCLEDNNDLFNLIRLFARRQTNSIVDKVRNNGCVQSGSFCRIWNNKWILISRCLNNGINLFNMDRSFVNSPNTSLVVKMELNNHLSQLISYTAQVQKLGSPPQTYTLDIIWH